MTSAHLPAAHRSSAVPFQACGLAPKRTSPLSTAQRGNQKFQHLALHHRHSLPRPFTSLHLSQVRTPALHSPLSPRAARPVPLPALLTAPLPFSTRRTWPACLPETCPGARRSFPLHSHFRCCHARSPSELTSPSSAPTALTCARSDPTPRLPHHRPGHLDTVRDFCDSHPYHCTATARPSSRPLSPSLVRTAPVFCSSGLFVPIWSSVTRSTLHRDGTGHNSERERAINTVRRNRSSIRHAARNAAAALCRSALPERRPHQVGERLGAWRVTAPVRLVALFVATTAAATSRVPFHPPTAHERPAVPFTLADAGAHGHAQ